MSVETGVHIWGVDELRMKMDEPVGANRYIRNRARNLIRAEETIEQLKRVTEQLGGKPFVYENKDAGIQITFDEQFIKGVSKIAFGMYYDLRQVDEGDVAKKIVNSFTHK